MKTPTLSLALLLSGLAFWTFAQPPVAPVRPVVDDYFGTKVTDPYRWMEDMKNPELLDWMKAQNAYTHSVIDAIPGRQKLLDRLTKLNSSADARVTDVHRLRGNRYIYERTDAKDNLAKLYVREGLTGKETLLVDPETFGKGGTPVSISYYKPSWNGEFVAVGLAAGGSENTSIYLFETATGRQLPDVVDHARFGGVSWLPDGRSFVYNRLQKLESGAPVTELEQKSRVYLHKLGTDAEADPVLFGYGVNPQIEVNPRLLPFIKTTPGAQFVIAALATGVGGGTTIYAAPAATLGQPNTPWRKVCEATDGVTDVVLHGNDLYMATFKDAPRYKVLRLNLREPDLSRAEVVVPPGKPVIGGRAAGMGALHVARDGLYVQQSNGGIGKLWRIPFDKRQKPAYVPLPMEGTIAGISSNAQVPGVLLNLTSWVKAPKPYGYDPATGRVSDLGLQPKGPFDEPADMVVTEVDVKSHDGVLVPLSIIHKRDLKRDGSNPTLLSGYGAYGVSNSSFYNLTNLAWLEQGAVLAIAHVRGGGEYGEEWHKAGQKTTKPNTWKDFIACAEYLVNEKYTAPAHLAGIGISAGGILIGRAITERPDLFGTAGIAVGWSNTLRQETSANGIPNIPEFGSVKTEEGFRALYEMDAFHHVKDGTKYPAVMLGTGINDPRVDPWFSAKMTARLQAATTSGKPVLIRVDYEAGHGPGVTKRQTNQTFADLFSFFFWQTGHPDFQPTGQQQASKK